MRSHRGWLMSAVTAEAVVAAADVTHAAVSLSGLLLLGPLLAAHRLTARATAALAALAVLLVLFLPGAGGGTAVDPVPDAPERATCLATVVLGGLWAVVTAHTREAAQRALARMTRLADLTQQAIARPLPPRIGGLSLAVHAGSSAEHAVLGGDLHDAVLTSAGPRLIVGDVKGHGVDAVPQAAAVLAAFRHTAATEPDPVRLVHALDARVRPELGPEDFVTLLVVDFTPDEVRLVNCGHPPPLRIGRRLDLLEPPQPSLPLGLAPDPCLQRIKLASDQRLLLYTDGLTEARDAGGAPLGLDQHVHAALVDPALDQALGRLLALLHRHAAGGVGDDLTLILVQPDPGAVTAPAPRTACSPCGRDHPPSGSRSS